MAITKKNNYTIGDTDLTAMVKTLDKTYIGKAEISLSAYSTTAAPDVKIGSIFDNNGTMFEVETADETPTGYAGITVSTTFYLYYDESEGEFIYLETVPTWSDAFQGWYNGNDRAFFSMYKDSGGTLYQLKQQLGKQKIPGAYITDLTVTGQVKWKYYHKDTTSPTEDELFQALDSWVPVAGDFMTVEGQVIGAQFAAPGENMLNIYRTNAIVLTLVGGTSGTVNLNESDTSAAATSIELMSNFDALS